MKCNEKGTEDKNKCKGDDRNKLVLGLDAEVIEQIVAKQVEEQVAKEIAKIRTNEKVRCEDRKIKMEQGQKKKEEGAKEPANKGNKGTNKCKNQEEDMQ